MNRRHVVGCLVVALVLTVPAMVPARADGPPFGEPYLVLAQGSAELRGPFPLGEERAVLLLDTELWSTDATPEGTVSIHPPGVVFERIFPTIGGIHWLQGRDPNGTDRSLWRTDGTRAGTRLLRNGLLVGPSQYHPTLGLFFFAGGLQEPGRPPLEVDWEPWVSDGTAAGTRLLRDILPEAPSGPLFFRAFGKAAVFLARDPQSLRHALWRSDGTPGGTRMVTVPEAEHLAALWLVGPSLYLRGQEGVDDLPGRSLWRSNGTADGTVRLHEFEQASVLGLSADLGNGRSLWTVEAPNGSALLWVTAGTPATTEPLMPLSLPAPLAHPGGFLPYRGAFYFTADDGTTGLELWKTDGTPEGTEVAFETCSGPCSDFGGLHPLQSGDRLVLWRTDPVHGTELHASDGTVEGTELLLDLCPGPCSADAFGWRDFDGWWLFFLRPSSGGTHQIWATDRTPEGTHLLTEFVGSAGFAGTASYGLVGGSYLFAAGNGFEDQGLWALPVGVFDPPPPLGDWLAAPAVQGFSFKVRISSASGSITGSREAACIPETVCVSGAVPGRSEVFLRVVGPKPNGRMWPTMVKFTTSTVEVWVRRDATEEVRFYRLEGARPGFDELPGLFDRDGFEPWP